VCQVSNPKSWEFNDVSALAKSYEFDTFEYECSIQASFLVVELFGVNTDASNTT